jgi:hypothetical protein
MPGQERAVTVATAVACAIGAEESAFCVSVPAFRDAAVSDRAVCLRDGARSVSADLLLLSVCARAHVCACICMLVGRVAIATCFSDRYVL